MKTTILAVAAICFVSTGPASAMTFQEAATCVNMNHNCAGEVWDGITAKEKTERLEKGRISSAAEARPETEAAEEHVSCRLLNSCASKESDGTEVSGNALPEDPFAATREEIAARLHGDGRSAGTFPGKTVAKASAH